MRFNRLRSLGGVGLLVLAATTVAPTVVFGQTASSTAAQQAVGFREETLKSSLIGRDMPYRVIVPSNPKAGERFAVVYLIHGLTGHYSNWIDKTKLVEYAGRHRFIIVTPEG